MFQVAILAALALPIVDSSRSIFTLAALHPVRGYGSVLSDVSESLWVGGCIVRLILSLELPHLKKPQWHHLKDTFRTQGASLDAFLPPLCACECKNSSSDSTEPCGGNIYFLRSQHSTELIRDYKIMHTGRDIHIFIAPLIRM